jgi:hypothetical protein
LGPPGRDKGFAANCEALLLFGGTDRASGLEGDVCGRNHSGQRRLTMRCSYLSLIFVVSFLAFFQFSTLIN